MLYKLSSVRYYSAREHIPVDVTIMGSSGPRQQYFRRAWEAQAEALLDEVPLQDPQFYTTTTKDTFTHPNGAIPDQTHLTTPPSGSSSLLGSTVITFWTAHRRRIHGATAPGAATHTFCRHASFTTPIHLALDPPAWPGWGT
ncbi:uncharacterized protein LOC121858744 [Homarus americanus]|uniref:uncharacterized protein LOC121858744 n=1 Tax=Homarus americanus TaxID=6706 RepID=UPI001C43E49A|nr:uncharacterized protein LOC121858744 [Homarus americanus]